MLLHSGKPKQISFRNACTQVITNREMFVEKAGTFAQSLFHFILSLAINLPSWVFSYTIEKPASGSK